jgi:hypothetical protein
MCPVMFDMSYKQNQAMQFLCDANNDNPNKDI